MSLTRLSGFYVEMGSPDYPPNFDPYQPFGFVVNGNGAAVFKYSIDDVEKSFVTPRTLTAVNQIYSNRTDVLYAEVSDNVDLKTEDITLSDWKKAYKILEYLYNNQASSRLDPIQMYNGTSGYSSSGDEQLANPQVPGATGVNPNFVSTYVPRTLSFISTDKLNRLGGVTFQCSIQGRLITFEVYFDANIFMKRSGGASYEVYLFQEMTGHEDGLIDQSEFKQNIVQKLFDILRNGRMKRFADYTVAKYIPKVVNGTQTSDLVEVSETFYVFTSFAATTADVDPFTVDVQKQQIIQWLRARYQDSYLRTTYPSLFGKDAVEIIPVYDNFVVELGGNQKLVHGLSLEKLRNHLNLFGKNYNPQGSGYSPIEIFYVGSDPNGTPYHNYPITAVEDPTSSVTTRPISTRFPDYEPKYIDSVIPTSSVAEKFHFYLMLALNVCRGIMEVANIDQTIRNSIAITDEPPSADHYNRGRVVFSFNGVRWLVYKPATV